MSDAVKTKNINGVNVEQLVETVGAVQQNARLGRYTFFGATTWKGGAYSETEIQRFFSRPDKEAEKRTVFSIPVDEPEGLLGGNRAANPVEHILAGLASCLVIGISYNAAARGITLQELAINLEGDINLEGFLGLKEEVRPGYQNLRLQYQIQSDASEEEIESLIQHVEKTSPVLDIVENPVPVERQLQHNSL